MFDLILLRGRGIEGRLGFSGFEDESFWAFPDSLPLSSDFAESGKLPIPPFESEILKDKNEEESAPAGSSLLSFNKITIFLMIFFFMLEVVFLLYEFLPE